MYTHCVLNILYQSSWKKRERWKERLLRRRGDLSAVAGPSHKIAPSRLAAEQLLSDGGRQAGAGVARGLQPAHTLSVLGSSGSKGISGSRAAEQTLQAFLDKGGFAVPAVLKLARS